MARVMQPPMGAQQTVTLTFCYISFIIELKGEISFPNIFMVVGREVKIYIRQITEWFKEFQCHKLVGSEILKKKKRVKQRWYLLMEETKLFKRGAIPEKPIK